MERQDVCLHIVGQFNDDSEREFLECTKALRLTERIKYDPWMPFHEAFQCLLNADIGLILFQPGIQNHVFALPHKMFDYMLAKLPVIAPDFAEEVRDIVNESRAGLLVDPTRPDDIAAAVDIILADKELRESLGARGRKAVLETYNWENEAVKLVDAYERLFEAVR
jgi:glycosyltransferase involved in cell wall biosynthesis